MRRVILEGGLRGLIVLGGGEGSRVLERPHDNKRTSKRSVYCCNALRLMALFVNPSTKWCPLSEHDTRHPHKWTREVQKQS